VSSSKVSSTRPEPGIAAKDDAAVTNALIPLDKWTEPDTEDNGQAIYSAQLLNLVAWDRRGWAPGAGDTGAISFHGESPSGAGGTPGTGGVSEGGGTTEPAGGGGTTGPATTRPDGSSGCCGVWLGSERQVRAFFTLAVAALALLPTQRRRRFRIVPRGR